MWRNGSGVAGCDLPAASRVSDDDDDGDYDGGAGDAGDGRRCRGGVVVVGVVAVAGIGTVVVLQKLLLTGVL